jgi:hypothetical protein
VTGEIGIVDVIGEFAFDPDALREKYREERDRRVRPDANEQYVEDKWLVSGDLGPSSALGRRAAARL